MEVVRAKVEDGVRSMIHAKVDELITEEWKEIAWQLLLSSAASSFAQHLQNGDDDEHPDMSLIAKSVDQWENDLDEIAEMVVQRVKLLTVERSTKLGKDDFMREVTEVLGIKEDKED